MTLEILKKIAIEKIIEIIFSEIGKRITLAKAMKENDDYKQLSAGDKSKLGKMVKSQIAIEFKNVTVINNGNISYVANK